MAKKILIYFGIFVAGIIASWIILSLITSLGGARIKTTGISYLETPAPLAPFAVEKSTGEGEKNTAETPSRLVIKTGTVNMVVKDILGSVKNIIKYTEDEGGWVVSSSVTEWEKTPSGFITVRVPAEIFDEAMVYFRGLAERVSYEGTSAQDVTEEYVDLQSRLKNLEATESQLLKIMERSGTIPDVLAVQREITNVREQIENLKGRMQYLERSVKMASITINLALSEELLPIPPAEKWRPKYVLLQTWKSVLGFWRGLSYFFIKVLVWAQVWVPLGIIVWLIRRFLRKRAK